MILNLRLITIHSLQSQMIVDSAYFGDWITLNVRERKKLMMILTIAKKGSRLSFYRLISLTIPTFILVCKIILMKFMESSSEFYSFSGCEGIVYYLQCTTSQWQWQRGLVIYVVNFYFYMVLDKNSKYATTFLVNNNCWYLAYKLFKSTYLSIVNELMNSINYFTMIEIMSILCHVI